MILLNSFIKRQNFRLLLIERDYRRQNKCDPRLEIFFIKGLVGWSYWGLTPL